MTQRPPINKLRVAVSSVVLTAVALSVLGWFGAFDADMMSPLRRYAPPPNLEVFNPGRGAPRFPPITDFPIDSAEDTSLHDEELVLGISIGDESRAYPINALTGPSREIINDTLGDLAIAATW